MNTASGFASPYAATDADIVAASREALRYYNYFGDYDPATGRYIESDPIGLDGGINTYLYADADPISMVDPTGENAAGVAAVGAAAWRICMRIPKCAAKLAELAKKAVELCKTIDCTVRFDKKGHPFDIPGQGV
nr:RHS repeat-associated core domain-containing protein [Peristeroidobacter soli]